MQGPEHLPRKVISQQRGCVHGPLAMDMPINSMDEMMPTQVSSEANCLRSRCRRYRGCFLSKGHGKITWDHNPGHPGLLADGVNRRGIGLQLQNGIKEEE